jgi:hypothetical protein
VSVFDEGYAGSQREEADLFLGVGSMEWPEPEDDDDGDEDEAA